MKNNEKEEKIDNIILDMISIEKEHKEIHTLFTYVDMEDNSVCSHVKTDLFSFNIMISELLRKDKSLMFGVTSSLVSYVREKAGKMSLDELIAVRYTATVLSDLINGSEPKKRSFLSRIFKRK